MRIKRWAGLAVAAGTLAGVSALPVTAAGAAATPATLTVQVGGDSAVAGIPFEGMRFLAPPTFTVHKGDTINFDFAGFHTATLLPDDQSPDEWEAENTAGLGSPYGLVAPDSDDSATQFEFNNAAVLPSDPTCGTATSPCAYDGKSVVNSGAPFAANSFAVTINDAPNSVIWVVCLIHPDMKMRISVVDDATATTTQSAIDSYKSQTLAADHEAAAALIPTLEKPSKHKTSGGKVVWDAYAGFDQDGWGLDSMFPHALKIKKGQTVRWHFSQLMGNIHTVTFPKKQAVSLSNQFGVPVCESASGDTPPTSQAPPFCTDPTSLELHVPGAALLAAGSHSYSGPTSGMHSSGVEGAGAPSMAPYDLKFTHRSNKKGFTYACIVHGAMMDGTVIVS